MSDVYRHPIVQGLRKALTISERRREHLEDLLRVSLNRDLQTHRLEALNPHEPGLLLPKPGGVLTIHVDAMRIRANRLHQTRDPIIRIVDGDDVYHCHALNLTGPSWMAEDYDRPMTGRASAVCVLQTADPIEVVR